MKKIILFIMTATMMSLSAQDTIPLFNQSFYFPMSNSIIFDSIYASNPHTVCIGVDCYEYPPYHLHNDWYIAYRTTKTDNVYDNYVTRLRIVDTHTNPPANINSQTYVIDYKEEPIDLAYSKNDETLILLQSITNIYNYNPKFAFLKPYYTWGYNADLTHFNNNITYNSLDIYNNKFFISVGKKDSTYIQQIASPTNEPNCVELGTLKVSTLNNNQTVTILDPLTWSQIVPPTPGNPLNTYNWLWRYNCGY